MTFIMPVKQVDLVWAAAAAAAAVVVVVVVVGVVVTVDIVKSLLLLVVRVGWRVVVALVVVAWLKTWAW
jgi:hypothetical protein